MGLRHTYTLIAPIYDALVAPLTVGARRASLSALDATVAADVLLCGIGSGLDIPWLPHRANYTGIDLTPAMLARARRRARHGGLPMRLVEGDIMRLPYEDASYDAVVMHLILAVVPDPHRALQEAARVLRPGGRVLILDKFLRPGQAAPLRRLISPLLARIATRTDVVFEDLLRAAPTLALQSDTPALAHGWFRRIVLERRARAATA